MTSLLPVMMMMMIIIIIIIIGAHSIFKSAHQILALFLEFF